MAKIKIFVFLVVTFMLVHVPANAAVNSFRGGMSTGANYTSNADRTEDDENSEWESTINASLSYTREVATGIFSARYAPTFRYNYDSNNTKLDHRVSLNADKELSDRWSTSISDTFVYTSNYWDNPSTRSTNSGGDQEDGVPPPNDNQNLSDRAGTRKLSTNYFSVSMAYEMAKNSLFDFGYNNRTLVYNSSDEDDYMYHNPWAGISYSFSPQWSSSLNYSYTTADYDSSEEDSDTHQVSSNLNYTHSVKDSTFAGLSYNEKNYDKTGPLPEDNNDYYSVTANLGWDHAFTPQTKLSISAGPSYISVDEDGGDKSNSTLSYDASLNRRFEQGAWYISGSGGYDDRAFDGADENLSKYYQFGVGLSYQLRKDLTANLSGSFRNDEYYEEIIDNYDEDSYNASTGLTYSFGRWYYLSARYRYSEIDSDLDFDDYTDHSFFINLGFSRELKRWLD